VGSIEQNAALNTDARGRRTVRHSALTSPLISGSCRRNEPAADASAELRAPSWVCAESDTVWLARIQPTILARRTTQRATKSVARLSYCLVAISRSRSRFVRSAEQTRTNTRRRKRLRRINIQLNGWDLTCTDEEISVDSWWHISRIQKEFLRISFLF